MTPPRSSDGSGPPSPPLADRLAFAASGLSSPFLVTAVTVTLVVILLHPALPDLLCWAGISVLFAALLPFLFVYRQWRRGRVTDVHVGVRSQRARPFAAALLSAAAGVAVLYAIKAPPELVGLGVVYLANGSLLALVSRRWKISVHTAVLTAAVLSLALVGYPWALAALGAVPLVLWARVHRLKHTLAQGLVPVLLAAAVTPAAYRAALALLY